LFFIALSIFFLYAGFFWGAYVIIDENVKEDLERNEVTGVDFEEIDFEIHFKN